MCTMHSTVMDGYQLKFKRDAPINGVDLGALPVRDQDFNVLPAPAPEATNLYHTFDIPLDAIQLSSDMWQLI
jgi:hypothetical protein